MPSRSHSFVAANFADADQVVGDQIEHEVGRDARMRDCEIAGVVRSSMPLLRALPVLATDVVFAASRLMARRLAT